MEIFIIILFIASTLIYFLSLFVYALILFSYYLSNIFFFLHHFRLQLLFSALNHIQSSFHVKPSLWSDLASVFLKTTSYLYHTYFWSSLLRTVQIANNVIHNQPLTTFPKIATPSQARKWRLLTGPLTTFSNIAPAQQTICYLKIISNDLSFRHFLEVFYN